MRFWVYSLLVLFAKSFWVFFGILIYCYFSLHCKEISVYVFAEKKLRGLSPNFHIHMYVSDLYIPTIGPPNFLQQNRQTYFLPFSNEWWNVISVFQLSICGTYQNICLIFFLVVQVCIARANTEYASAVSNKNRKCWASWKQRPPDRLTRENITHRRQSKIFLSSRLFAAKGFDNCVPFWDPPPPCLNNLLVPQAFVNPV